MYRTMKIAVMMLVFVGLLVVDVSAQEQSFDTIQHWYRTWTSNGGNFTVEAKFVAQDFVRQEKNDIILERKDDNRKIRVPSDRLSEQDHKFINSLWGLEKALGYSSRIDWCATMPVVFASIDDNGKITINGTITSSDRLFLPKPLEVIDEVKDMEYIKNTFNMEIVETDDYIGRGYTQTLTRDEVYFCDLKGNAVSYEEAAKRLQKNTAVFLGRGCTYNAEGIETLSQEALGMLVLVDFNSKGSNLINISAPTFQWQDKATVPMPPEWLTFQITDGNNPSRILYTVAKPVFETRAKQVSYTVEDASGIPETRVTEIFYTVCKFVPETRVREIPDSINIFDRDISEIGKLSGLFPVASDEQPIDPAYLSLFKDGVPVITMEKMEEAKEKMKEAFEKAAILSDYTHKTFEAANDGYLDDVKYFVGEGVDVNAKNQYGHTLLHALATNENCNAEILKYLAENGADVNAIMRFGFGDGWTPLHYAAYRNPNIDVLKTLIEVGADVHAKTTYDWTPLHSAARYNSNGDIMKYLIDNGAEINAKKSDGKTPLDLADTDEKKEILRAAGGKSGEEL